MIEVLYLLSSKENYDKYLPIIDPKVLTKETQQILEDMTSYYKTIGDDAIDWSQFSSWFSIVRHPSYTEERLDLYKKIFLNLSTYAPTGTYSDIVQTLITREYAAKIADKSLRIADGTESELHDIQLLMDEYQDKQTSTVEVVELEDMPTFEDLHAIINSAGAGLEWRLDFMNQSLGPLRLGDFVVLGKRPECGGTTFVTSECTFMAAQLPEDRPVLYVANEESEIAIRHRIKQAAIGLTTPAIMYDYAAAETAYEKAIGGRRKIQLKHKAGVSIQDIIGWCEAYNPGLIIIDQLWKVRGFEGKSTGDVQRLTSIFQEARVMSQKYAPIIAVHQADATAVNEKWLGHEKLYMVKTAAQGEADAIIMIGNTDEVGLEHMRYLNITKNKLLGGPSTDESLRHGKAEVRIRADIARFTMR